jgi:hypothetical protein
LIKFVRQHKVKRNNPVGNKELLTLSKIIIKRRMSKLENWIRDALLIGSFIVPFALSGCKKHDENPPVVKSFGQSVVLQYDSEPKLVYSASFTNVNGAELTVTRDGMLVSTEEIGSVSSFNKTFKYSDDHDIMEGKNIMVVIVISMVMVIIFNFMVLIRRIFLIIRKCLIMILQIIVYIICLH